MLRRRGVVRPKAHWSAATPFPTPRYDGGACHSLFVGHQKGMETADHIRDHEPLDPRLLELYRRATPTQKLAVVARLNGTLIGLKEADLRARQPALPPEKRQQVLRRWWLGARD
jgi:hypothetical protein